MSTRMSIPNNVIAKMEAFAYEAIDAGADLALQEFAVNEDYHPD